MPKLIYHDSDGVDKVITLAAEPLLIGRATECHIQTQDAMVSRRHARIVWDGGYWIEDLGSSNGVYVGHEKVQRAAIRPGDTVTCGSLVLRLMPDAAPRPAAAPAPAPARAPTVAASPLAAGQGLPPPPAPPPPAPPPAAPIGPTPSAGADNAEERGRAAEARVIELEREAVNLKRKVEQLTADLKRARQGMVEEPTQLPGDEAMRMAIEAERDVLRARVAELEKRKISSTPPAGLGQARDPQLADVAVQLSDAMAELRGSLRAATGEAVLLQEPAESVEVVRDALKAATEQLEAARTQVRALAKLLGV